MDSCLSFDSNDRPTFVDIHTKLQHYVDEDYYFRLDERYNTFNELMKTDVGLKCQQQSNLPDKTTVDNSEGLVITPSSRRGSVSSSSFLLSDS